MMSSKMELSNLRALVALSELGTFANAGERLHLSAPAVFDQIRKLEMEAGEKLYERAGRKLRITQTGQLLIEYARRMLQEHDAALEALKDVRSVSRGVVRFGCGPHMSVSVIPHLFRAYLASYPNVEIRLITGDDHLLFDRLRTGAIDLLMMNLPVDDLAFESIPLWKYEMVLVVSPGDPCANDPAMLAGRPFIMYQRAYLVEAAIQRFCIEAGFQPRIVMQIDQADSIKELIKLGLGISLLPVWSVSEEVKLGTLRVVRLPNRKLINETGITYRKTQHVPAAVRALCEVAKNWKSWLPTAGDVIAIPATGARFRPAARINGSGVARVIEFQTS